MSVVAIIPARGGSKRIPGKNVRLFLGKPIIVYSIEAARGTGLFDRIVISTDSDEIASVATQHSSIGRTRGDIGTRAGSSAATRCP